MSLVWHGDGAYPEPAPIGAGGWARAGLRGAALVVLLLGGLAVLLPVRLLEWPLTGARRPISGQVPVWVSRAALVILGIRTRQHGRPMTRPGAVVANHVSWLDIFVLNARKRVWFVAKAEVARWPFIGWLAHATGTVFIRRDPREARAQVAVIEKRLKLGQKLLFFPEGTSSDGRRVLSFKSTLFAAFLKQETGRGLYVQPLTLVYRAPEGADSRFYGWWGDMALAPHMLQVLAQRRQGAVDLIWHAPVEVSEHADRKTLARTCQAAVERGLAEAGISP
ncbi:MAG TPA: 1-acyl-sn-glycerol-3-phosphate acyltransferase [Aliiroseovarius sp.]|nr:1-acyl-sn-glycerol-3-phosphate acyltransferase [Aliiroseovarius sp.]